jgi:F0F1-type ATP synthase membrane subunit b/b'
MVMAAIDPLTKAFTDPQSAIKKEIEDVSADKTIPDNEKKQLLEELNEALKAAQPIQFPGNVELVKKYYDKIDAALG